MHRVGRNATWLLASRLASQGLLVLFTIVLAGRLGAAGLGEYAFLVSVVFLANVGTTFGTDMVLIRETAGSGRAGRWPAALWLQLGLSAVVIAVVWVVAPLLPGQGPDVATALQIYILALVPMAVASVCGAVLRGVGRMSWYAMLGLAAAGIQLVAAWALIGPAAPMTTVALVLLAVQISIAVIAAGTCAWRVPEFRVRPGVSGPAVTDMARASAPIALLGVLGILYQRLGVFALSALAGPAATGWFAASYRVVDASKAGHVALFGALYPAMSAAHSTAVDGAGPGKPSSAGSNRLDWSWRVSVAWAFLVSAGLVVGSPWLIGVLYGPEFEPSVGALAILALTVVPSTIGTYQSLALVASHEERRVLMALVAGIVALGAFLTIGIPLGGLPGGCWAVVGGESVLATALVLARRRALLGSTADGRRQVARAGRIPVADGSGS